MKLHLDHNTLRGADGEIRLERNADGLMDIKAQSPRDLAYGLGVAHGLDRQLHALLMRIILRGTAAEDLVGDQEMIDLDMYMRRYDLLPDPQGEIAKLQPHVLEQIEAYCDGLNLVLENRKTVFEMRLLGYSPEPWTVADCLLIGKAFGFIGLVEAQGGMEKLLLQIIQQGLDDDRLRELFPYLSDPIDRELLGQVKLESSMVPETASWICGQLKFNASNNWVVAGALTKSGKPLVCGDPHLEINRLPAIWYETAMHLPDDDLLGVTIPGVPGLILGRNNHLAWSATYSFVDMIDFRMERCQDGRYERDGQLVDFTKRTETIGVRKGDPVEVTFYETPQGVLEGDPNTPGLYLSLEWTGRHGCGADLFNCALNLGQVKTVPEAMELLQGLHCASFVWAIGDSAGNIGMQMTGRFNDRPDGVSGLLPTPGWDSAYDSRGFISGKDLPHQLNPDGGIIITANNDLNHLSEANPINLPMGDYRARRIEQLLRERFELDVDYIKEVHHDLYSLQAERFMAVLRPLLPDDDKGRVLAAWDCRYDVESVGATLFTGVYHELLASLFGDHGLGREVIDHLMNETGLLNDYYANFDNVLLSEQSAWFEGLDREKVFRGAISAGLAVTDAVPYGQTRQVMFINLLLGNKLPRWAGFDRGPYALPGSAATVAQGQIFTSLGRQTTFAASYRLIADMALNEMHTSIVGGPSDRRFSKWYNNYTDDWLAGVYKLLK